MARQLQRGLTLIEILVALSVAAILGALALPALGTRLHQQRLNMAAETLAADIHEARFQAARLGAAVNLNAFADPSGGAAWCWTLAPTSDGPASATSTATACACLAQKRCSARTVGAADHPGVKMTQGQRVSLAPDGSATASAAANFESPNGARLRVDLLALGRSRICTLSGPHPRYPAC